METSEILSSTENVKTISNYNVKRIKYIDIMKGVAIICVVLCHAVESAYSGAEWIALSNMSKIFKITFDHFFLLPLKQALVYIDLLYSLTQLLYK